MRPRGRRPRLGLKRKLASGQKAIYTRNRVFLIAPLAAESLQKNAFPYDQLVSGRGVYAYTAGNPASLRDPSGLCVQFDMNSSSSLALMLAYAEIGKTVTGRALEDALERSPIMWTITDLPTNSRAYTAYDTATISVDPDFHPLIFTDSSSSALQEASTDLILEHEIGHAATGISDEMQNIIQNEIHTKRKQGCRSALLMHCPYHITREGRTQAQVRKASSHRIVVLLPYTHRHCIWRRSRNRTFLPVPYFDVRSYNNLDSGNGLP